MQKQTMQTDYKDCLIALSLSTEEGAVLKINGIVRDRLPLPREAQWSMRLNSTVQTDYEWHEFIEARLSCSQTVISIVVLANGEKIMSHP
ncbi:MAG: hypothetical protein OEZ23_02925 [Gammaproteobacteria bacterium]|nr:hypothetical protein [Gammaproteobacteria bacterium]